METASMVPFYLAPILALPVLYVFYNLFLSPLRSIPGPLLARISRLWLVHHSRSGDMHSAMIELHARHGALVRTGPNEVSVSDLAAVKKIYAAATKFRKSDWYSVWQGTRKFDLFAERDEGIHGQQRRLVSAIYSMQSLQRFQGKMDEAIKTFVERMQWYAERGEAVDFGTWAQLFAFDVVGILTFSKSFGFMENGKDDGSFGAIEGALQSAAWVGQVPWVFWLNDWFVRLGGSSRLGLTARHGGVRQFAATQVNARRDKRMEEGHDILAKLFEVHDQKPVEMNDQAVLSMATSNVFAGSDTTAISLRSIIYYLLKNPACLQKLLAEIDERKTLGRLSDPVKLEEANEMPYLQACMYEGLRLHPAVGMSLPRVVPEGGVEIDGRYLPAGTIAGVNPWVVHRNEKIFGEDVHSFRPERWLGKEQDVSDMHRYFFAFGGGSRMCLGRNLSWMEMSKLVPTLLSKFELRLADPAAIWKETCWWFVKQQNISIVFKQRS